MKNFQMLTVAAFVLILSGCQNMPSQVEPIGEPSPQPSQVECPVCPELVCPAPQVVEKIVTKYKPAPIDENAPTIIGAVEWAFVEPGDIALEARVDSGAETSSIHAEDIQVLEKDGKRYVRFSLEDPQSKKPIPLERRLHRTIIVKQNVEGTPDRRYVVRMWVTVGKTRTWLDVSLSNRSDFEYGLLLGRNMLVDDFIVDVSKHHTQPKKRVSGD